MEVAVLLLAALNAVALGALAWRWRYAVDVQRVADNVAAQMLEDWRGETWRLEENGVKTHATGRYMQLVTVWGLPVGATDAVARLVWQRIAAVQGEPERVNPQSLYE